MPLQITEYLNLNPYFVDTSKSPGFNWEKFQDKIDTLPDNLFYLLVAENSSEFTKSLTQKYVQLSAKGPDMARLIRDVTIGDVFIGDMPQELSRRLGVDLTIAREMANLIVAQLFAPVLEELKQLQRVKFPNRVSSQRPAPGIQTPIAPMSGIQSQAPIPNTPELSYPGQDLPESGGNIIDLRNK